MKWEFTAESIQTQGLLFNRYAALGQVEALRKLIVELDADVNLPMKDGTTPAHCAAENGHEGN